VEEIGDKRFNAIGGAGSVYYALSVDELMYSWASEELSLNESMLMRKCGVKNPSGAPSEVKDLSNCIMQLDSLEK